MASSKRIKLKTEFISLTTHYESQEDVPDYTNDPATSLERRTTDLAELLGWEPPNFE